MASPPTAGSSSLSADHENYYNNASRHLTVALALLHDDRRTQCCGSVNSTYRSGSSTLARYGSGSSKADNIQTRLDPDPYAGLFMTVKSMFQKSFSVFICISFVNEETPTKEMKTLPKRRHLKMDIRIFKTLY